MKYKVKGCPNYDDYFGEQPTCNIYPKDCQNIPDCDVKKVIEGFKEFTNKKDIVCGIAEQWLKLYKIEECEE